MKRFTTLFLLFITVSSFAQSTVKLQVAYLQDHQYSIDTKNIISMTMDAQVDDATREQMKASGMTFPMVMDMNQEMTTLLKTGKANDKKEIPISLEYTKFTTSQKMGGMELPGQDNPARGFKAVGWSDQKGKVRIENVEGAGVTEEVKKIMIGMFDQVGAYVAFPDKPLKVGDSFLHEVPFSMPMQGGSELKMIVKTTYKLTSFDSNNALFDTVIDMSMDVSVENGTMNAKGSGTGNMVFDIKKNFLAGSTSNIDLNMKMKMGPTDMDIKSKTKSEIKVTHL